MANGQKYRRLVRGNGIGKAEEKEDVVEVRNSPHTSVGFKIPTYYSFILRRAYAPALPIFRVGRFRLLGLGPFCIR